MSMRQNLCKIKHTCGGTRCARPSRSPRRRRSCRCSARRRQRWRRGPGPGVQHKDTTKCRDMSIDCHCSKVDRVISLPLSAASPQLSLISCHGFELAEYTGSFTYLSHCTGTLPGAESWRIYPVMEQHSKSQRTKAKILAFL